MKFVVVHWIQTNETGVMEQQALRDTSMLTNFKKQGMVYHKEIGKKAQKGGWKAYMARMESVNGKSWPLKHNRIFFTSLAYPQNIISE